MSFRFRGGERLQRGRGIGGILRFLRSFFTPALSKLGGTVVKAAQSKAGKVAMNALKEQAVDSGMNLAIDALRGRDMKESLEREVSDAKKRGASTLERINKKRRVSSIQSRKKRDLLDG